MSRLLQTLALVAVFAAPGLSQDAAGPSQADRGQTALERGNRLDPEQQERMRGRFERWQKLSVEERDEYKRRSDELGRARKEALRQLRKEDRERFETLDKATQDGVLRELTHLMLVERTQRLRDKLPPEAQARLEGASPEERRAILHELRRGELHKAGERALEDLARKLGLTEEEIEVVRALDEAGLAMDGEGAGQGSNEEEGGQGGRAGLQRGTMSGLDPSSETPTDGLAQETWEGPEGALGPGTHWPEEHRGVVRRRVEEVRTQETESDD